MAHGVLLGSLQPLSPRRARRNKRIIRRGFGVPDVFFSLAVISLSISVYSTHCVQRGVHIVVYVSGSRSKLCRIGLCLKMRTQKSES